MRIELHMAQAAPAEVAAARAPPLFCRLRRVVEEDDRVVALRHPLVSAEPPRAAIMLFAANMVL